MNRFRDFLTRSTNAIEERGPFRWSPPPGSLRAGLDQSQRARMFFTRPPRRAKTRLSQASTALEMIPPSSRSLPFSGMTPISLQAATCEVTWLYRCGSSHPPNPGRAKTRPFPRRRWRYACSKFHSNHPSKLACTSLLRGGLGCFQLRAWTRPFRGRAFGEQRKLPSLPIQHFAEPSNDRAMRFASPEQSSDMGVILFTLVCRVPHRD